MPVLHLRAAFNYTFLDTTVQSVLVVLTLVEFVEEYWKEVTESTALKVGQCSLSPLYPPPPFFWGLAVLSVTL
jgi:hypothetical protein